MPCTYCGAALDATTDWAHVVPAALGGRVKSRDYRCTGCNHEVSFLESNLSDRVRHMSAMVGGVDRDNKPIVAVVEHGGRQWHASNGRLIAKGDPPRREDGRLIVELAADPGEQVRRLASVLRSQGWPAEALIDGRFWFETGEPKQPPPATSVEGKVPLMDPLFRRAVVKIAVELVGFFDVSLARHANLSATRRFVKRGTDVPEQMFEGWSEASGLWSRCVHNWEDTAFRHSVEVWTFAGALHYRLILFSELLSGPGVESRLLEVAEQRFEDRTKRLFGENPRYVRAAAPDPQDLYERVKAAMASARRR